MKAIQVKVLAPTNTRGSRLKAWAEGLKGIVCERDYEFDLTFQAESMVNIFIKEMGWEHIKITGFGSLPNGDWVATLGAL